MKLNNEQRKLVEDNHKLIYFFASKNNIDVDEYYDILALALCQAAYHYDKTKGAFSTIAMKIMELKMLNEYRIYDGSYKKNIPRNKIAYYENSYLLEDYLPPSEKTENIALKNIKYNNMMNKLKDVLDKDEAELVNCLLFKTMNKSELGRMFNVSHQTIRNRIRKISIKLRNAGILDDLR